MVTLAHRRLLTVPRVHRVLLAKGMCIFDLARLVLRLAEACSEHASPSVLSKGSSHHGAFGLRHRRAVLVDNGDGYRLFFDVIQLVLCEYGRRLISVVLQQLNFFVHGNFFVLPTRF